MSAFQRQTVCRSGTGPFRFTATRDRGFRFNNGQFAMIARGRAAAGRAYSVASANEQAPEFLSIKVLDGALTSHLQKTKGHHPGREQPTDTLVAGDLVPGKNLLLSTETGHAPFGSLIKDPEGL